MSLSASVRLSIAPDPAPADKEHQIAGGVNRRRERMNGRAIRKLTDLAGGERGFK